MKENQNRNSWFVSKGGLFSQLFFVVLSIYFQAWVIGAFLCFVFLLSLGSGMWSRLVLKKLEMGIEPVHGRCHAGEQLILKFHVRNRGFLPLVWLDILVPTGKKMLMRLEGQEDFSWFYVKGQDERQTGIQQRFAWLLWQQEIAWEERIDTFRRGVVEMKGAGLQAGDGFGLSANEMWKHFEVPLQLIIYPKLVPVRVQPFLKITQEAVAENRGQTEDITILKTIHPYQPGDPSKHINWRLLASSGKMEVNVYETVMPGCAAFVLDLESFLYEETLKDSNNADYKKICLREEALETMLSLMASCMTAITEQGIGTALIVPGYGYHEAEVCLPDGDEPNLQQSLELLARVDYQADQVRFPYEEFWRISHKLGNIYICTWSEEHVTLTALAEHLGRSRVRYLALENSGKGEGEMDCLYGADLVLEPMNAGDSTAVGAGQDAESADRAERGRAS